MWFILLPDYNFIGAAQECTQHLKQYPAHYSYMISNLQVKKWRYKPAYLTLFYKYFYILRREDPKLSFKLSVLA